LDKRFVQLTLLLDQGEEAQGPRWQANKQFQNLHEVLDQVPDPAIVLLGPPGSGKSTLLRHYELDSAQATLEALDNGADAGGLPLTFFLPLNSYKPARSGNPLPLPKDWLSERWRALAPDLLPLETLLRQQRITLLLDALNEIPAARAEAIQLWKDFLGELARDCPGNRVIFSCRSLDYSAPLSSKDLRVPQVRIEPLSDEQVQQFLEAYCPEYRTTLWKNLKGTPQLELLRSPYFLKLLVEQTQAGEVPEGRAALFTGFVRQALKREVEGDNPLFQPSELLA
jgi:predicted NACHT family NTPase